MSETTTLERVVYDLEGTLLEVCTVVCSARAGWVRIPTTDPAPR